MLKLLSKYSNSFLKQSHIRSSILRVSSYSTKTKPISSDTLHQRIKRRLRQRDSMTPVLDKWVVEGRPVDCEDLKTSIKFLRKIGRFKPALEIAEWMSDMKYFNNKPAHVGVHLDLISKVHGLNRAEQYFDSLDDSLHIPRVYGALLNCYADAKVLEKAEAVMDEIRNLNSCNTLDYNTMLSLYSHLGEHEKLDSLMQEMENKGVGFDEFTYNIPLNAFATNADIEKMERLLRKMEIDPQVSVTCYTYITASKGYFKVGFREKASSALLKAEHLIKHARDRQTTYGVLLTIYAAMREKEHVYRIWDLLRNDGRKTYYKSYAAMITSLEKLNDFEGIEKIFEEWEKKKNKNAYFDIRVPNTVIRAYCKEGLVREADAILSRVLGKGEEPSASTWSHMALGYRKSGEMEKAIEMTKKAIGLSFPEWKPDFDTVGVCLEFLIKKGDGDGVQEILMMLEKCGKVSILKERDAYDDEKAEA